MKKRGTPEQIVGKLRHPRRSPRCDDGGFDFPLGSGLRLGTAPATPCRFLGRETPVRPCGVCSAGGSPTRKGIA
jgi:hypothetical protein